MCGQKGDTGRTCDCPLVQDSFEVKISDRGRIKLFDINRLNRPEPETP